MDVGRLERVRAAANAETPWLAYPEADSPAVAKSDDDDWGNWKGSATASSAASASAATGSAGDADGASAAGADDAPSASAAAAASAASADDANDVDELEEPWDPNSERANADWGPWTAACDPHASVPGFKSTWSALRQRWELRPLRP